MTRPRDLLVALRTSAFTLTRLLLFAERLLQTRLHRRQHLSETIVIVDQRITSVTEGGFGIISICFGLLLLLVENLISYFINRFDLDYQDKMWPSSVLLSWMILYIKTCLSIITHWWHDVLLIHDTIIKIRCALWMEMMVNIKICGLFLMNWRSFSWFTL